MVTGVNLPGPPPLTVTFKDPDADDPKETTDGAPNVRDHHLTLPTGGDINEVLETTTLGIVPGPRDNLPTKNNHNKGDPTVTIGDTGSVVPGPEPDLPDNDHAKYVPKLKVRTSEG